MNTYIPGVHQVYTFLVRFTVTQESVQRLAIFLGWVYSKMYTFQKIPTFFPRRIQYKMINPVWEDLESVLFAISVPGGGN